MIDSSGKHNPWLGESLHKETCYWKAHSGQRWSACEVPSKTFTKLTIKFRKIFAYKPKVKTVTVLHISSKNLPMDILRDSQLVMFFPTTIFVTFSYKSLAVFSLNSCKVRGREVAYFCVWPLCDWKDWKVYKIITI